MDMNFFTLPLHGAEGTITYLVQDMRTESDGSILYLLSHPMCPAVLLPLRASSKEEVEALQTQTQGKSYLQRWIEHAVKKSKDYLDASERSNSESLALILIVNRRITSSQKAQLSNISGKIAVHYFDKDLRLARRYIRENYALLDDYNKMAFDRITLQIDRLGKDGKPISPSEGQRVTLFNIAGIALSQGDF